MNTKLDVLLAADSENDTSQVLSELRRTFDSVFCTRVDGAEAFAAALTARPWDLVLANHRMQGFAARHAVELLERSGLDIPMIVIDGAIDAQQSVAIDHALRAARKRAQKQALLAASVAHQINNPLAALLGNLDLIAAELGNPRLRELLADVRAAAERVSVIGRDLKLFSSGRDAEQVHAVDAVAVLESSLRLAADEIGQRARLRKELAEVPPVEANQAHLHQVLLNQLLNAAHAIPEGAAERHELRVAITRHRPEQVGPEQVAIEIRDRDKGTLFRLLLPVASDAAPATASPASAPATPGRRARVLVVDDDEMVARGTRRTLAKEHDVEVETEAERALARVTAGERFDLILCDLMMPHMTGMELHAALKRVAPDQADKMIFMSGGAFTPSTRQFLAETANQHLEKPVETHTLREIVRRFVT